MTRRSIPYPSDPGPGPGDALPPLRKGAPYRKPRGRGSLPQLVASADRNQALEDLARDMYAASSLPVVLSRLRTVHAMFGQWQIDPYPISVPKVYRLGASLKSGRYRSSDIYLSAYKVHCERRGDVINPAVLRAITDVARSCSRGQGPPIRAAALPFGDLHKLPGSAAPFVPRGPIGPRHAIIVGT